MGFGRGNARREVILTVMISGIFEVLKHLAFYLVGIAQIVHVLQYEACDSESGCFDSPREGALALLLLHLMPHGIKDSLQAAEGFGAARGGPDLHETLLTPILCVAGAGLSKSPL